MLVRDYQLPSHSDTISVSNDIGELFRIDAATEEAARPALLVWRDAFNSRQLLDHFSDPGWPLHALQAMPPSGEWAWKLKKNDGDLVDADDIRRAVSQATGAAVAASGNVHVTLELRSYEERNSQIGGLEWWMARRERLASRNSFGQALVEALVRVLSEVDQAGAELFTEQISIVLSKDSAAPATTLTPTLHADRYYGQRETAIVSILEEGWYGLGGALFLPAACMDRLWQFRPITVETLLGSLSSEMVVQTNSGDVLIYDGMLCEDGSEDRRRGVPHVSPDVPGQGARLCILMYRRQHRDRCARTHTAATR